MSVGFIILDGFQSTKSSNKEDKGQSPAPAGKDVDGHGKTQRVNR